MARTLVQRTTQTAQERPTEVLAGFNALILLTFKAFGAEFTEVQEVVILAWLGFLPAVVTWFVARNRKRRG